MASLFSNFIRKNCITLLKFRKTSAVVSISCRLGKRKNVVRVASHLSESVDLRKRESNRRQHSKKFPYPVVAVLGIIAANYKDKEEEDSSATDVASQSQSQSVTPSSSHHEERIANGRFTKAARGTPKSLVRMREGYKTHTAKRKLEFEDGTDENEPPSRCQTRSTEADFQRKESIPHGTRLIDLDTFRGNLESCIHCRSGPLSFHNVMDEETTWAWPVHLS
ncbi:hypothetical protein OS493_034942 [Desmophyllum pertusum]|uniref:Uncharacterized protein n=1 Tax=Desmophyllum pertusum TaxID=174260 RepID=A0A9W9YV92_9CNID|nr:hypothetical protein OS493_034942 [Desmophyllum pertusum]